MRPSIAIAAVLVAVWFAPSVHARDARPVPSDAHGVAADTLRTAVRAGEALIVTLPAQVGGAEATYRVLEAPALSWLVDRSFYWRTLPSEQGLRLVQFERTVGGAGRAPFVLAVEVVGG